MPDRHDPLEGVVAVTGASSGIGEATARHLAARGARVVLGARRTDRLDALAEEIAAAGGEARAVRLDVTDRASVAGFVAFAQAAFGRLDVLVSNAGLMALSLLEQGKTDEWERMIDVNVTSVGDRWVGPTSALYSATKFAVRALSEGLRQEVGRDVRVTVVAPGATESELANGISDPELRRAAVEQFRVDLIPAEAVARAIAYAVEQPAGVDVNEIVVRPTAQAY